MKRIILTLCVLIPLISGLPSYAAGEKDGKTKIQIALLLDTSSSMDGLIDQARSQLWKIINELAVAHKGGKVPALEVALFEYGKSSIPSGEGHLRMVTSFTHDLDKISAELYSLTTNGGDEYCGLVIDSAVRSLQWDSDDNNLKLIFIAGNEPFDQGEVNYKQSVKRARSKGIIVNTIFCGDRETGINSWWKDGADIAGGRYISIDQNIQVRTINAPQDAEITRLGVELNNTYISYGKAGMDKKKEQEKQDSNAMSKSESIAADRSISKASAHYDNSEWDIVDAASKGAVDLKNMKKDQLPAEMQNMDAKEREEYVKKMEKKREDIKNRINKLNEERRTYIQKKEKENKEENTLDSAIIKTVREQAKTKKFEFK
jgi:hypothetical protein